MRELESFIWTASWKKWDLLKKKIQNLGIVSKKAVSGTLQNATQGPILADNKRYRKFETFEIDSIFDGIDSFWAHKDWVNFGMLR